MDDKGHEELMKNLSKDAHEYRQKWIDEKLKNSRLNQSLTEANARVARLEGALKKVSYSLDPKLRSIARTALAASQEMKKAPPISERGQVD